MPPDNPARFPGDGYDRHRDYITVKDLLLDSIWGRIEQLFSFPVGLAKKTVRPFLSVAASIKPFLEVHLTEGTAYDLSFCHQEDERPPRE